MSSLPEDAKKQKEKLKKMRELAQSITPNELRSCLESALYTIYQKKPFLGSILQSLTMSYNTSIPTACVGFDNSGKKWVMYINPVFFCKILNRKQRIAVMYHELEHLINKHPIMLPMAKLPPSLRPLMNIAADMHINQNIQDLPDGCPSCPPVMSGQPCENHLCPGRCIDVKYYYDEDDAGNKTYWEKGLSTSDYYFKLLKRIEDNSQDGDGGDGDGEGGQGGNGGGGRQAEFDNHDWDGSGDEKEMLDATEDLVRRAMQKESMSFDDLPGGVRDLLQEIDARRAELDYKRLIMSALKRSVSGANRQNTWARPSRRFGTKAPGSKYGELPSLHMMLDSSGSISIQEANDFLDIVDNFLQVGSRKCKLSLWHTKVYHTQKYNMGQRVSSEEFESGGTCLKDTLKQIHKEKPDLTVILTDGYYSDVEVEQWLKPNEHFPQIVFVISADGTSDHPLKRLGETVKIPSGI